jgi:Protein of unknown function (DUF3592)
MTAGRIGTVAVGSLTLCFLAAALTFVGFRKATQGSAGWLPVQAEITASKTRPYKAPRSRDRYTPEIEYVFQLGSKTYSTPRDAFNINYAFKAPVFNFVEEARAEANRYPVGTRVSVLYDPANPERSCLSCETDYPVGYAMLLGGVCFGGVGLLGIGKAITALVIEKGDQ